MLQCGNDPKGIVIGGIMQAGALHDVKEGKVSGSTVLYCCRPENSEDMYPGLAGIRSDVILLRDPVNPLFQNCDFTMVLDVW